MVLGHAKRQAGLIDQIYFFSSDVAIGCGESQAGSKQGFLAVRIQNPGTVRHVLDKAVGRKVGEIPFEVLHLIGRVGVGGHDLDRRLLLGLVDVSVRPDDRGDRLAGRIGEVVHQLRRGWVGEHSLVVAPLTRRTFDELSELIERKDRNEEEREPALRELRHVRTIAALVRTVERSAGHIRVANLESPNKQHLLPPNSVVNISELEFGPTTSAA